MISSSMMDESPRNTEAEKGLQAVTLTADAGEHLASQTALCAKRISKTVRHSVILSSPRDTCQAACGSSRTVQHHDGAATARADNHGLCGVSRLPGGPSAGMQHQVARSDPVAVVC